MALFQESLQWTSVEYDLNVWKCKTGSESVNWNYETTEENESEIYLKKVVPRERKKVVLFSSEWIHMPLFWEQTPDNDSWGSYLPLSYRSEI